MSPHQDRRSEPPEAHESLWRMVTPPAVWALHFLLCYLSVAVWCSRIAGRDGSLDPARLAIAAYTVVALAIIALCSVSALRRHQYGEGSLPHDEASSGDRHRFLGFATLLLAGLSAVATIFTALPALFFRSCL